MSQLRGTLTPAELAEEVGAGAIDTVVAVFTDLYGRCLGKRFDAGFFLDHVAAAGAHACNYLFTVDVGMEPVPGYAFASWEQGYGDVHFVPDLATLRRASWLERSALVVCDVVDHDGSPLPIAPRSILRRQVESARAAGFEPMMASELEFYLFRTSFAEAAARGYAGLPRAGWYSEDYHTLQASRVEDVVGAIRRHLRDSAVPVENSKGEWGLGQHELNVRYADALTMADRHVVYKQCAKEVAEARGASLTFMAKPHQEQAGSSCPVHVSLWRGGANAFDGDDPVGPVRCSPVFRWFLGGWMAHARELLVLSAPNVNSYKRYQSGSWAPTRVAWSYDNRTVGFRVVGARESLRIECRIPGADCNPYLAFAAALAAGLDGIARRIEPPPAFAGDAYRAADLPEVPRTLRDATELFSSSAFARQVFGDGVVEHYAHFFRAEQAAYERAVTDWERRRYFEQI